MADDCAGANCNCEGPEYNFSILLQDLWQTKGKIHLFFVLSFCGVYKLRLGVGNAIHTEKVSTVGVITGESTDMPLLYTKLQSF